MALQGNLDAFPLPEVIRLLARSQQTGVLVIETDAGETRVYLEDGHLVFACDSDSAGLYHALVTGELVTEAGWEDVISGKKSAADVLAPSVSLDEYETLMFSTVVDSFVDALETTEAAFEFADGVTTAIDPSVEFGVEPILVAAEERAADWVRLRELLPSRRSKLRLAEAWTEQAGEIISGTDEWAAISMVTRYKTRAAISHASGWSEHTTAVRLANLLGEGLIELVTSASGSPVEVFGEEQADRPASLPDSEESEAEPEMTAAEGVMLGLVTGDALGSLANELDAIAVIPLADGEPLIPFVGEEVAFVPFVTDSDVEFELKGLGDRNTLERTRPIKDEDLVAAVAHVELPLSELLAEHRVEERKVAARTYAQEPIEIKFEDPELEPELQESEVAAVANGEIALAPVAELEMVLQEAEIVDASQLEPEPQPELEAAAKPGEESLFETYAEATARTLAEPRQADEADAGNGPEPELELELEQMDDAVAELEVDPSIESDGEASGVVDPATEVESEPEIEQSEEVSEEAEVVTDIEPELVVDQRVQSELGQMEESAGVDDPAADTRPEPEPELEEPEVEAPLVQNAVAETESGSGAELSTDPDDGGLDIDVESVVDTWGEGQPEPEPEEFGGLAADAEAGSSEPELEVVADVDVEPLDDRLNDVIGSLGSINAHLGVEMIESEGELDVVDNENTATDTDLASVLRGLSHFSLVTPVTEAEGIAQAGDPDDDTSTTQESDIAPEAAEEVEWETKPRKPKRRRSRGLLSKELSSLND